MATSNQLHTDRHLFEYQPIYTFRCFNFFGIESKITISLCYALGLTFSFLLNKTFTFSNNSKNLEAINAIFVFNFVSLYIKFIFTIFVGRQDVKIPNSYTRFYFYFIYTDNIHFAVMLGF